MRLLCRCGKPAECNCPEPRCRACAIAFYEGLVRVGAGLAALQAVAPAVVDWPWPVSAARLKHQAPSAGTAAVRRHRNRQPLATCRHPGCTELAATKTGTLCITHRIEAQRRRWFVSPVTPRGAVKQAGRRVNRRPRECRRPECSTLCATPHAELCLEHQAEVRAQALQHLAAGNDQRRRAYRAKITGSHFPRRVGAA